MSIAIINPIDHPLWDTLLRTHPFATVFHSSAWLDVLAKTYQFEFEAIIKTNTAGEAIAGIHYCILDKGAAKRIVSIPFSDFTDPLVQNHEEWQELVQPLMVENCPISTRPLHNTIPLDDKRFVLSHCAKWHGIDLRPSTEHLWKNLHESARRAIRKSQAEGLKVRIAKHEDLASFYKLHLRLRKQKYRLLAQPYRFFEHIWQNFVERNQGLIFLAEFEGEVVGALFFLCFGDVFTYKFSVSSQDKLHLRPTDLLIWEAMQYGKAHGFSYIDLGLSDWEQEGLIRFKCKYASIEKSISFLRYNPPDYQAPEKPFNAALPALTELFTRDTVPDEVTAEAGSLLYQFFT